MALNESCPVKDPKCFVELHCLQCAWDSLSPNEQVALRKSFSYSGFVVDIPPPIDVPLGIGADVSNAHTAILRQLAEETGTTLPKIETREEAIQLINEMKTYKNERVGNKSDKGKLRS